MEMPAAGRRVPPPPPDEPDAPEPPFYEATEDLTIGGNAGVPAAVFYRPGDRVSPPLVEANGWGGKVKVPDQFKGVLAQPAPPDDTAEAGKEE